MTGPDDLAEMAAAVGLRPAVHRRADVESLAGIPHTDMVRWWRAMGFAEVPEDDAVFGDDDVAIAATLGELLAGQQMQETDVLRLARVLGASFSRIAEAQVTLLADAGALDDHDLVEFMERSMLYVWRRHVVAALGRRLQVEEGTFGAAEAATVGFVDIAGFSKLSKRIDTDDLGELVDAFEAAALEVIAEHQGRVVKFIGDAVMYLAPDLTAGVRIGLDLQARAAVSDVPLELHCGVAQGPTVTMGGDVFGSSVNLASRLTDIARRNTVVIPRDFASQLEHLEDLSVRPVRRSYDLKGFGRTKVATVRLAERPAERRSTEPSDESDVQDDELIELIEPDEVFGSDEVFEPDDQAATESA